MFMTQEKMFYGLRYDGVFKNVFYQDEDSLRRFLSNLLTLYYRKKNN